MTKKMKIVVGCVVVLCIVFTPIVFATETVQPMIGEEIETGEGYQDIVPIGGETVDIDENQNGNSLARNEVDEDEEIQNNTLWSSILMFIGVAILITVLLRITKGK